METFVEDLGCFNLFNIKEFLDLRHRLTQEVCRLSHWMEVFKLQLRYVGPDYFEAYVQALG